MSTTTILFNSPALHSLKRDQLVKLCKIHTLKASGKKTELIERLQFHAKTLPLDDLLSIATRKDDSGVTPVVDSEDETTDYSREGSTPASNNKSRPAEQWEVVMDTIAEVDEETLRSNRGGSDRQTGVGEFGTHTSKASVTSSLKALANSLGLKRNICKASGATSSSSSVSSQDVAQSTSTLPTSDPSGGPEEPPVEPVPGQSNLQGRPAPSEARLSFSQAPATTTIRLVSNPAANPELFLSPPKLQPFATSFDLVPGTPGGGSPVPVWPLSPGGAARKSLYPSIPDFQGFGALYKEQPSLPARNDNLDMDVDMDMPGGLPVPTIHEPTPEKPNTGPRFNTGATPKSTEKPSAKPIDIFSPVPKPQNASTRSRLGISRTEPFVFGSPLPHHNISNLQFRTAAQSVLDEMNKRLVEEGVETVNTNVLHNRQTTTAEKLPETQEDNGPLRASDVFDKIHQKEFDKMDSIASHYAAKRGAQSAAQSIQSKKRKSNLVVKEKQSGLPAARHRPNGSRVASGASMKTLPSHFGDEDEEDEVVDRRMSKRPRVEREETDVAQLERTLLSPAPDPEEESRRQKEREAIRRRLDHNKAKRRSSMGRPSIGHPPTPKAKPVRAGFFASAKSLVQNVWNRGAGYRTASNVATSKSAQLKEVTKAPARVPEAKKTVATAGSSGAPSLNSRTKQVAGNNALMQPNAPGRSTLASPGISCEDGGTAAPNRTSRLAIPSFDPPSSSAVARSSTVAGYGQSNKRGSSIVGFSSLGKKSAPSTNDAPVPLAETKVSIRTSSGTTLQKPAPGISRPRTTSRLMAPTASSLAKTNAQSRIPVAVASHNENSTLARATSKQRQVTSPQPGATLESITNSPQGPVSYRPTKIIFSQPLSPPGRPVVSLTAAATSIVQGVEAKTSKPPIPPKPKVLPGRKPRISRSKVIARLASQRAAGASTSTDKTEQSSGKVRSSMGAEAVGKTRQSYSGATRADVMMSAKKRVRQSEQARRRSRATASEAHKMAVD